MAEEKSNSRIRVRRVWVCHPCEKLYARQAGEKGCICTTCKGSCVKGRDRGQDFFQKRIGDPKDKVKIKNQTKNQQLKIFVRELKEHTNSDQKNNFLMRWFVMLFPEESIPEGSTMFQLELKVHYFLYLEALKEDNAIISDKIRRNYNAAMMWDWKKVSEGLKQLVRTYDSNFVEPTNQPIKGEKPMAKAKVTKAGKAVKSAKAGKEKKGLTEAQTAMLTKYAQKHAGKFAKRVGIKVKKYGDEAKAVLVEAFNAAL